MCSAAQEGRLHRRQGRPLHLAAYRHPNGCQRLPEFRLPGERTRTPVKTRCQVRPVEQFQ